jgi:ABC-type transport system involved in multi-copper enzyme maturation permease subunit
MHWQLPLTLGGPVPFWELYRSMRRLWPRIVRYLYIVLLIVQFLILSVHMAIDVSAAYSNKPISPPAGEYVEPPGIRFSRFCWEYSGLFLQQQLILLLIATPAIVAGALGEEKERGTLQSLLGTELVAREIVLGKLLGRLALLFWIGLPGLPFLLFVTGLGDLPVG